jgi:hypothetical protein
MPRRGTGRKPAEAKDEAKAAPAEASLVATMIVDRIGAAARPPSNQNQPQGLSASSRDRGFILPTIPAFIHGFISDLDRFYFGSQ